MPASYDELVAAAGPLIQDHWAEVSLDKGHPPAPDDLRYRYLESIDALIVLVARVDSMVVGYSVSFVTRHMHYDFMLCANDVLFVAKEHRGTSLGSRLMAATIEAAKVGGAERMGWHCKDGSELHRALAKSGNYRHQDHVYTRSI